MPLSPRQLVRSHLRLMRGAVSLRKLRFGRPKLGSVVLFHVGRCGSTVLARMLEQHSQVRWGGELFHDIRKTTPGYHPGRDWVRAVIQADQYRQQKGYFGFETKAIWFREDWLGMTEAQYLALLKELRFTHYIVLNRRNLLRAVVSAMIGFTTRTWHADAAPVGPTPIELKPDRLIALLDSYARFYRVLEELLRDKPHLNLTYEDDIESDPLRAYRKTCESLKLTAEPVKVQLARTNPYPLRQMLTNFDTVSALLRATPYEWMLDA